MKTRYGFVSNSSSTNFIVAFKNINIPCPHCGRKDPDFLDLLEKSGSSKNQIYARTTKKTLALIKVDEQTFMDVKEYRDLKKSIDKYKNNNEWDVAAISLSYYDDQLKKTLNDMVASQSAIILHESKD